MLWCEWCFCVLCVCGAFLRCFCGCVFVVVFLRCSGVFVKQYWCRYFVVRVFLWRWFVA